MGIRVARDDRRTKRLLWRTLGWVIRRQALYEVVIWDDPQLAGEKLRHEFSWARTRALETKYRAAVQRYAADQAAPPEVMPWKRWRRDDWAQEAQRTMRPRPEWAGGRP